MPLRNAIREAVVAQDWANPLSARATPVEELSLVLNPSATPFGKEFAVAGPRRPHPGFFHRTPCAASMPLRGVPITMEARSPGQTRPGGCKSKRKGVTHGKDRGWQAG